jgi:hypothetical protein
VAPTLIAIVASRCPWTAQRPGGHHAGLFLAMVGGPGGDADPARGTILGERTARLVGSPPRHFPWPRAIPEQLHAATKGGNGASTSTRCEQASATRPWARDTAHGSGFQAGRSVRHLTW